MCTTITRHFTRATTLGEVMIEPDCRQALCCPRYRVFARPKGHRSWVFPPINISRPEQRVLHALAKSFWRYYAIIHHTTGAVFNGAGPAGWMSAISKNGINCRND
jgi:hypothetical protein